MLPLAALAQQHSVAVLAVTHLRKKEGAAIYRAMGSLAFVAAARAAWLVAKDPKPPQRRLLLPLKNNLAADVNGLSFTIKSDGTSSQPIIHWSPDPIEISADSIVGNARPRGRPDAACQDAMDWLRNRLANGPAPARDVQEEADAHGISKATVRRAFRELRGEAVKTGFGLFGEWMWRLPRASPPNSC
jgi:putative DNA primase/helicase